MYVVIQYSKCQPYPKQLWLSTASFDGISGASWGKGHGTQLMQRPFVSSPYFSTVMFTPLYLERDQPVGPNTPGTSTPWKCWGRWPSTKPEETKWGLWCAEDHEFRPLEVLDLSRKCYSQLISIHRTQHGHCPLVWFYAQNPMYPPQGRRPFWSLSYKTEELQRIHPPCVGYLWAKVTQKKWCVSSPSYQVLFHSSARCIASSLLYCT